MSGNPSLRQAIAQEEARLARIEKERTEAFGELRRLNPAVRVVLASGYSHVDVASRFAGKGLAGVLQKPYTLAKLRESLAVLVSKRHDGEG